MAYKIVTTKRFDKAYKNFQPLTEIWWILLLTKSPKVKSLMQNIKTTH